MEQKEDDGILKNPLIAGQMYQCEMIPDLGGCGGEYPGQDIIAIAESGIKLCHSCYDKFLEMQIKFNRETKESFDAKSFFGPDDTKEILSVKKKIFDTVKEEEEKNKTILDIFDEREKQIEAEKERRRHAREYEEFRINHREYMRVYMRGYNSDKDVIQKHKRRYSDLKSKYKDSEVIDDTTPVCPNCGNPKCGKAGFLINSTGKYQRRKCMKCEYVYTNDWNVKGI